MLGEQKEPPREATPPPPVEPLPGYLEVVPHQPLLFPNYFFLGASHGYTD